LAADGYVVLTWSARGFGRSGGSIHLDSLDYEIQDGRRLLDVLAQRRDVELDAPGDPRVGVAGASYGGAFALMLAGVDHRVDAIVPSITWNDLGRALFPQNAVGNSAASGVLKKLWAGYFFAAGGSGGSGECGRFAPDVCRAYAAAAQTGRPTPELLALLARSSPASVLAGVRAPTLLVQGEADSLFPLSEADATARALLAHRVPVSVVWYAGGHDAAGLAVSSGGSDDDRVGALTRAWFDHYLRGRRVELPRPFEASLPDAALSTADSRAVPVVRTADSYPVAPPRSSMPLAAPPQRIAAPPGGSPAIITSVPGLGGLLGSLPNAAAGAGGSAAGDGSADGAAGAAGAGGAGAAEGALGLVGLPGLPGQTAAFATAPVAEAMTVLGASQVSLRVTTDSGAPPAGAVLFAGLVDVAPDGSSIELPQRLVSPLRLTGLRPGQPEQVDVQLPWIAHEFPAGHRLVVTVSTTDFAYALPDAPATYTVAAAGELRVPMVSTTAAAGPAVIPPGLVALVLLLVAVAAALLLLQRRRQRAAGRRALRPELGEVPLVVDSLVKDYGHGVRAVDDLSLRVERGMVLGLLGPNGAGKTTTLRMLLGLIAPTAGELVVFGQSVVPGAPVLDRVGAFIEGPGFLPHLSGLDNLQTYWAATGRPREDSHLDEVLAIAGLGDAVHRKVRTYSQGMRQRLAIAQAMLGLPDLLVLDEPTNGLDPPQIREMRRVLQSYAVDGRTVLVSSHLLAEVEQTCTDVVVMAHGSAVAAGPVSELVGAAGSYALEVADPAAVRALLSAHPDVVSVEASATGVTVALTTPAPEVRARLVRDLVAAGHDVTGLAPARRLEDVFLALVEEDR
ncbi:MAG: ATP-binding cassette domain-containing protein, partial [Actinomycetales bacterium]